MLSQQKLGLVYGLTAYTIWGLFPWYFHFLTHVNPWQVLTQRIIWSFLLVSVIALFIRHGSLIKAAINQRKILLGLLLSSLLIAANWLIFIWAVGQGRVVESSLGYFITPLVSVVLARFFLKESLDSYRLTACLLAVMGVCWLVLQLGVVPWVSISLAVTFGFYGLVRKKVPVDSLTGLLVETGLLFPFAFTWFLWLEWQGQSQLFSENVQTTFLLIFSGVLTAAPLLLFASAANRLSLTAVGFMMYINPTMQFLTAIYLLKEPFNHQQLIAFMFIWIALVVFSIGAVRQQNAKNQRLTVTD
ncbi:EamA family transporter RarD [uncultured Thiothrix sp.]|uniref:EamA family transporter RarD n=1 Tax=uncultured Thiothrix sp. TaxID=223185 RepID=UPI0026332913|nr:EamA family transporter RarD [uncultured Thiothrix sp.]